MMLMMTVILKMMKVMMNDSQIKMMKNKLQYVIMIILICDASHEMSNTNAQGQ